MIATITSFRQALTSPHTSFNVLRDAMPVTENGVPVMCRTSRFAEARATLPDGRHVLLHSPLSLRAIGFAARIAERICALRSAWLGEYRLLEGEMRFTDPLGREQCSDIIVETLPEGVVLADATSLPAKTLREGLTALQQELLRIGFTHNNLHAKNIIVGDDGLFHAIRPHYGSFGSTPDDFSSLFALADSRPSAPSGGVLCDVQGSYHATKPNLLATDQLFPPHEGLIRVCRANRYGFIDTEGCTRIPFIYIWATDIHEDRAVVETESGVGVIDKSGTEILPTVFDDVEYNLSAGEFGALLDGCRITYDYNGHRHDAHTQTFGAE